MASVFGIVKNHGGTVTVESQLGLGTIFHVYLPAATGITPSEQKPLTSLRRGSEQILLVDDEEHVRRSISQLLTSLGYEVLCCAGGREASKVLQEHGKSVSLVILDLIMPDWSGFTTFHALRDLEPEVKILLYSGYTPEGESMTLLKQPDTSFLQKPFDLEELSKALKILLG